MKTIPYCQYQKSDTPLLPVIEKFSILDSVLSRYKTWDAKNAKSDGMTGSLDTRLSRLLQTIGTSMTKESTVIPTWCRWSPSIRWTPSNEDATTVSRILPKISLAQAVRTFGKLSTPLLFLLLPTLLFAQASLLGKFTTGTNTDPQSYIKLSFD